MTRWARRDPRANLQAVVPALEPLPEQAGSHVAPERARNRSEQLSEVEGQLRPAERWQKIMALAEALASERFAKETLAAGLAYPVAAYGQFRRDVAILRTQENCWELSKKK